MSINPQTILLCLGVAALAVAATLLGLAVRTFFHDDIHGVMDDLSGKRRAVAVGAGRGRRRVPAGSRRSHTADTAGTVPPVAAARTKAPVPPATQPSAQAAALSSVSLPLWAARASSAVAADGEDAVETAIDEDGALTLAVSKRWDDPEATTVRPSRPTGERLRSE